MVNVAMQGSVLPPGIVSKVDLGDKALIVHIAAIQQNDGDDCLFYKCTFPDGFTRSVQSFLPSTVADLLHQLINIYTNRYGLNVSPTSAVPAAFAAGDVITFAKESN